MSSRRMFLKSVGGAALCLPVLPSLLPRSARADAASGPRRLIALMSQSGQFVTDFWPTATPPGYQTRDDVYGGPRADGTTALSETIAGGGVRAPLADFAGAPLSPVLTEQLEPYYDKMLLLLGLDYLQGTSHGTGPMLGNYANCAAGGEFESRGLGAMPTIDQVLAQSDTFYPTAPRARSLVLGTGSPTNSLSDTDYGIAGGPIESVPAYINPRYLWEDLFGDFMDPDNPVEHPNRKLVNALYDDYARLRSNSRMSSDDKLALERHMSFIDDIERELGEDYAAGCTKPDDPGAFDIEYPYNEVSSIEDFQRAVELLVDVSAAAIRCDMTRVVTMQVQMAITDALGTLATSYHNSADVAGDWHDFAHSASGSGIDRDHLVSLNRWVSESVFKRYLERLDVEEAGGRTYLDNSIVYWGGELSMDHYVLGMPAVLAGGAGGCLETGYYVDYTKLSGEYANAGLLPWGVLIPGLPHNRLLVTMLQSMGLTAGEYERDGLPGYGHNERFSGPYNLGDEAYDFSSLGQPLPGIFVG
ncbi:MAG: DUF1552 domain-containing protein [Myxococcota bacterium]